MNSNTKQILERAAFLHAVGRPLRADDVSPHESLDLNRLCSEGYLLNKGGHFVIENHEFDFVDSDYSKLLMSKVERYKFVLSLCPFVRDIAICNTVAFGVANEESDIDLLIIIDDDRFYIGRFLSTVLIHVFGLRRHHNKVAGRFCLSFFISDKHLDLSELMIEDDIYFYYWFYYLVFLKSNYALQQELLESNKWFNSNNFSFSNVLGIRTSALARLFEAFVGLSLFDWLENLSKNWQVKRALQKQKELGNPSGVEIKDGILKFHVVDIREEFRDKFYRSFAK